MLGGSGDGAAGGAGGEGCGVGDFFPEGASYCGEEVVDVGEFLELEELGDVDGAVVADLAEVVAEEVGDHDELGDFFGGGDEIVGGAFVVVGVGEAWSCAFDGAGLDGASGDAEEALGGGGEDLLGMAELGEVEEGGVGGGGGAADLGVELVDIGLRGEGGGEALGEVDLVDVAGGDVVFGLGYNFFEVLGGGGRG